jgi:hypothetical protein
MTNTTHMDPRELKLHPMKSRAPRRAKDDPTLGPLIEDVRARGIQAPLICVEPDLIVDGEDRWIAARRLHMTEVPVTFCRADEVASVILSSLTRKHFSKGALAYVLFPIIEPAFNESKERRLRNLRRGQQAPESTLGVLSGTTVEEFAERIGLSRMLLFQAKEVRAEFDKDTARYEFQDEPKPMTLREYYEPRLLSYGEDKPLGLGAILAGIAGLRATGGKHRPDPKQLELFESALDTLKTRFSYWKRFDEAARSKCREVIRSTVAAMPQDLRDELAAAIKSFRTGTRKGAK